MKLFNLGECLNELKGDERFKMYRELWRESGNFKLLPNFPLHLDIELSGICNLRCESCYQNGLIESPLGLMDFKLFQRIVDEGAEKGLCALKLQIRGESFLHPRLFDFGHLEVENGSGKSVHPYSAMASRTMTRKGIKMF